MPKGTNVGSVWFSVSADTNVFKKSINQAASNAQSAYSTAAKNIKNAFSNATKESAKNASVSMKSQAATLAAEYRKQGMSQSDAFKKAWAEIERTSKTYGKKAGKKYTEGFNKPIKNISNNFSSAMRRITAAIGTAFSVAAVVSFGKKCVQVASETQSAWVGLNSILNGQGKSFNQANKFIQQYISDGLVPLNNAVTAYKNLAARGYSTEQIEKTLTALKDAAAFGRQASYSYGEAIQTATEGLKNENSILVDNAGVTKNVAKMWDDYAKSIGTTSNNLTQQQKIQAEVAGILAETKWQTGDAAKYSDTFAGRIAKLSASFTSLKTTIGNVIIPILNLFLPAIQTALDALSRFLATLQTVMASLGLEMPDVSSLSSVTSNAVDAATAISSTGTAAETAAKKAKKAFASFDEINVLNTSIEATSSIGSGSAVDTSALSSTVGGIDTKINIDTAEAEETLSKFRPIIEKIKEKLDVLRKIDFKPLKKSFDDLWRSLKNYGSNAFKTLEWAYDEILVPLATWTIEDIAPAAVDALSAAYEVLSVVLVEFLNPALDWLWNNALQPITAFIKDALIWALEQLTVLLYDIAEWITDTAGDFREAWKSIKENAILAWEGIQETWTIVSTWFDENIIQPVSGFFSELWESVSSWATENLKIIQDNWETVSSWFDETVIQPVAGFFTDLWDDVGTKASDAWESVKNAFSPVGTFFSDLWTNTIKPKFTEIGTKIGETVGDAFKTAINGALAFIESVLNTPIKAINGLLDIINKVPGINLSKLTELSLPRLAQGGWVAANNPQLAIVGDNRREGEIIAPESKIREAVEEALRKVGNSSTVQTVKLAIELIIRYPDGRTVIKQINEAQIAEGRILLEV